MNKETKNAIAMLMVNTLSRDQVIEIAKLKGFWMPAFHLNCETAVEAFQADGISMDVEAIVEHTVETMRMDFYDLIREVLFED